MRIVRFLDESSRRQWGVDLGDGGAEVLSGQPLGRLENTGRRAVIAARLAPLEPVNIFCIGLNYRAHAQESHAAVPDNPVVFMKPTTALLDPGGTIRIPACADRQGEVDFEGELAVVIGTPGRDIPESDALRHVLGYTIANDVSARKWQRFGGGGQFVRGKSFDTFMPLGPVLITADEIPDPQTLRLTTMLNGVKMQDSHTGDMIFSVAKIIAFLSRDTTLLPGTVILTGTPAGVGVARTPPVWLKPGDRVAVEIERIGTLENIVK